MAIDIELITERSEVVEQLLDEIAVLGININPNFTEKSKLLKYINPYGLTIFNQLQVKLLIEDLEIFRSQLELDVDKLFVDKLIDLVKTSLQRPHLFIRFVGD